MKKHVASSLLIALCAVALVSSPAAGEDAAQAMLTGIDASTPDSGESSGALNSADVLPPPAPWQGIAVLRSTGAALYLSGVDQDLTRAPYAPAVATASLGMSLSSYSAAAPSASTADLIVEGPNSPYGLTTSANYGNVFVGYNDSGVLNHSDGTLTVSNTLSLGAYGPDGTYNLSGTGAVSANSVNVGFGTLNQSAGTLTVSNNFSLDFGGTYNLSGGAFSAANVSGDPNGSGAINQSGGTITVSNQFSIGDSFGNNGSYDLSGTGVLSAGTVYVAGNLGVRDSGSFTSSGNVTVNAGNYGSFAVTGNGSLTTNGTLTITGGQGRYNGAELSGNGSISAATISFAIDLGMNHSGGTMTAGVFKAGNGGRTEYSLSGGTLSTGSEQLGQNGRIFFYQSGGTHTVTGDVDLGNNNNNNSDSEYRLSGGTYSIGGALRLYDVAFSGASGTFFLNGGTLHASSITGAGTLILNGGTLQAGADGALVSVQKVYVNNGGGVVDSNGRNLTISSAMVHDSRVGHSGNAIDGGLRKIGAGTLTLTGANTYTGATTVSAGTLQLARTGGAALNNTTAIVVKNNGTLLFGGNNQLNQAPITLGTAGGGGTPAKIDAGGFSQGTGGTPTVTNSGSVALGALTLVSNAILDMAGTSVLHFANSSGMAWGTGTLSVYNWSGTLETGGGLEQLLFGGDLTGLNGNQLMQVSFYSDSGSTLLSNSALILGDGEIIPGAMTPVPEPGTWAAGVLAILAIAYSQHRRFRSAPPAAA